jgi:hypothetical protein
VLHSDEPDAFTLAIAYGSFMSSTPLHQAAFFGNLGLVDLLIHYRGCTRLTLVTPSHCILRAFFSLTALRCVC